MDNGRAPGPRVSLLHAVPGRLRFLAPEFIGKAEAMKAFLETIADVPGLVRVVGRPATGALILEYEGDIAELIPVLIERGGMRVVRKASAPPLAQTLRFALALIDQKLAARSEGALDARTGAALLLGGLAVFQAARGRVLGPSTTLLMGALTLLEPARKG